MPIRVLQSDYAGTARTAKLLKESPPELLELAFIGRSNAGKSTLINRLLGRKNLARVSGTPGSTKMPNFYRVRLEHTADEGKEPARQEVLLVDLPGYGYAHGSKETRGDLEEWIEHYLSNSPNLRVLALLIDARRAAGEDELMIQAQAASRGIAVLVILTKFDQLNQKERAHATKLRAKEFGLESGDLVFSGEGIPEERVWARLSPLFVPM